MATPIKGIVYLVTPAGLVAKGRPTLPKPVA